MRLLKLMILPLVIASIIAGKLFGGDQGCLSEDPLAYYTARKNCGIPNTMTSTPSSGGNPN